MFGAFASAHVVLRFHLSSLCGAIKNEWQPITRECNCDHLRSDDHSLQYFIDPFSDFEN